MARRTEVRELICSFCGKAPRIKLIAGPTLMICDECVEKAVELAGDGDFVAPGLATMPQPRATGVLQVFRKKRRFMAPACSFCGSSQPDMVQPPSPLGTQALICGGCRELCRQIISEELGRAPDPG